VSIKDLSILVKEKTNSEQWKQEGVKEPEEEFLEKFATFERIRHGHSMLLPGTFSGRYQPVAF
jgi:hypothetical protein